MRVVPMIHVPDVGATVRWYATLGFNPIRQNEEDGEVNWALLSSGETELMFNAGGKLTPDSRREVDLYVHTEGVDEMHERLKDRVQVVEEPHDTFYGMRELIIRDLNGFWITFAQPA
jgi:catechol 2,3-dioxygenase-like lactoylglutathione lyase family enzyme